MKNGNKMNKKGTTLVELMVYMVLGILVVGFALQAISHIAKNYVQGREVTKVQQNGRDAINVMARDLANTGFKYYILKRRVPSAGNPAVMNYDFRPTATSSDSLFLLGAYTGSRIHSGALPADFEASFYFGNLTLNDTIEIFRGNLGTRTDTIISIERITYKIVGTTLYRYSRRCTNLALNGGNIDWSARDTMAVLENAKGLQFQYSADGVDWRDAPTGIRNTMKYIHVSLLASSDRESDFGQKGKDVTYGNKTVTRADDRLYRSYEEIVPIPNNGVVQ